ncbi:hypothetical protein Pve01_90020 [Planomonospora venezuelensis]|nr:hypothetical protein Pve01_90020 [Planomonospora venezuelensis]
MNSNNQDVPFHARHDDELLTLEDVAEILRTPVGDLRTFIRTQRLASQPVLGKPKAV